MDGRWLALGTMAAIAAAGAWRRRGSRQGTLGDLIRAQRGMQDSDFWLDRAGKPTRTFDRKRVGVKVVRTDILLPDYLYYVMEYLWGQGLWQGTEVTPQNVRSIAIAPTGDHGPPRGNAARELPTGPARGVRPYDKEVAELIEELREAQGSYGRRQMAMHSHPPGDWYQFDIKAHGAYPPRWVEKALDWESIGYHIGDRASHQLDYLHDWLVEDFDWVGEWTTAGRSGGYLLLRDDESVLTDLENLDIEPRQVRRSLRGQVPLYDPEQREEIEEVIARGNKRLEDLAAIEQRVKEIVKGFEEMIQSDEEWEWVRERAAQWQNGEVG